MGKRYTAILKYLDVEVCGHDVGDVDKTAMAGASGFIVATPTKNHLADIRSLFDFGKPILCEKPFTTELGELAIFEDKHREDLALLTLVNQYQYLQKHFRGNTEYDYFKSGNDGLAWDCTNVIGMAEAGVSINNQSPYWHCKLNGSILNLGQMDHAYISMIRDWLNAPKSNWAYARKAHEKVMQYMMDHK